MVLAPAFGGHLGGERNCTQTPTHSGASALWALQPKPHQKVQCGSPRVLSHGSSSGGAVRPGR